MDKKKLGKVVVPVLIVAGLLGWMFTAPYLGNTGLSRTPGIFIGGTEMAAPSDLTAVNGHQGPMMMKMAGFPPFVVYLSFVGTPDYIISATRPDGGYWAQRVRDRGGDGWLRFGDETYPMRAEEVTGDARIPLLEQWSAKSGMSMDGPNGGPDPLRDWEVFLWTPR